MLTDIIQWLREWLATTSGSTTVAILLVLGLILSIIFAVFATNLYSQYRKLEIERDDLLHSNSILNSDLRKNKEDNLQTVKSLRKQHELESNRIRESCQAELVQVTKQKGELEGKVSTLEKSLEQSKDASAQELKTLQGDLQEYLSENGKLRVGASAWGKIITEAIQKKAVSVSTYFFALELKPSTDPNSMGTSRMAVVNVSDDVNLDAVSQDTKFDMLELNNIIENFDPSSNIDNSQDPDLGEDAFFGKELKENPSIGWDNTNIEYIKARLGSGVRSLLHASEEGAKLSPVYMVSILYIGSLKCKLVITDFNTEPTAFNTEAPLEKLARDTFFDYIQNVGIKARVNGNNADIIILSKELREAMGGAFKNVEIFNTNFLKSVINPK